MIGINRPLTILLFAGVLFSPATKAQNLDVEVVAAGLNFPVYLTSPPADTARLFVLEYRDGRIRIIKNGTLLSTSDR